MRKGLVTLRPCPVESTTIGRYSEYPIGLQHIVGPYSAYLVKMQHTIGHYCEYLVEVKTCHRTLQCLSGSTAAYNRTLL